MAKVKSSDEQEISSFIKILVGVLIIIAGIALFTKFVINKDENIYTPKDGEVDFNLIMAGSIFNRPESEYYVLAYKTKNNDASTYASYVSAYQGKEKSIRIYYVDLDSKLNESYYNEKSNVDATSLDDLKMSSPTLIKIKDKKIVKYVEGSNNIKSELGL